MAWEEKLVCITFQASADLSASQYCFMKVDSNDRVAVAAVDDAIVGVLQDNVAALGRACQVAVGGVTKVKCGGNITKGGRVTGDSTGRAIALTSGDAYSMGVALETGTVGVLIAMLIQPLGNERSSPQI